MTLNSAPVDQPSATRALSFNAIRDMVAECLAIEVDEVAPESRFFEDLAGESIDLLELSFLFEKAFQIRAPYKAFTNKELWERDESGQFTSAARELMQRDFAYLELERRIAQSGSINPRELLTIELMFLMLQHADDK